MGIMLWVGIAASVVLPGLALAVDLRRHGAGAVALSPFWYFTFLWCVSFPFRAWLLGAGITYTQSGISFAPDQLAHGLAVGLVLWGVVWAGYRRSQAAIPVGASPPMPWWPLLVLAFSAMAGIALLMLSYEGRTMDMGGRAYFASRAGHGLYYLIPELPFLVMVASVPVLQRRINHAAYLPALVISLVLMLLLSKLALTHLGTRRNFALLLFLAVIVFALARRRRWAWAYVATLGTLLGSFVLEFVRVLVHVLGHSAPEAALARLSDRMLASLNLQAFVLSASFEGVDHVARYLALVTPAQLATGLDHGVSWLFNMGLSLVPRALWPGKPLATGNLEQQEFLYPHKFENHISEVALPPGFVVDYLYGFGIPGALVLAYVTGWLLRRLGESLVREETPVALRALALFIFANMFNLVRSGTGFIGSVVMFSVVLLVLYGPARCWEAARALLPRRH